MFEELQKMKDLFISRDINTNLPKYNAKNRNSSETQVVPTVQHIFPTVVTIFISPCIHKINHKRYIACLTAVGI